MNILYIHGKTNKVYSVTGEAINTTNGVNDGKVMVIYESNGQTFVKEKEEFLKKFEKLRSETESI